MPKNIFEWDPKKMSVNEPTIDLQHRELLNQLNVILCGLYTGVDHKIVEKSILFLNDWIEAHKVYEENYMFENKYPGLEDHIKKHNLFREKFTEFKRRFDEGFDPTNLIIEIEQYLGDWLFQHILKEDQKYAIYIANKNKENKENEYKLEDE